MAFDDDILHDVGGLKSFALEELTEGWRFKAACGIGVLTGGSKPTIPFSKGVVVMAPVFKGQQYCDDPQLVAAFCEAFEGYNPFVGNAGAAWAEAHTAPGDRTFDFDTGPRLSVKPMPTADARKYLLAHGVFHPGVPA